MNHGYAGGSALGANNPSVLEILIPQFRSRSGALSGTAQVCLIARAAKLSAEGIF